MMALVEYLVTHPEERLGQAIAKALEPPMEPKQGFVIRYADDGDGFSFNQGSGWPVELREATIYPSREVAEEAAKTVSGVEGVHDIQTLEAEGFPQPEFFYVSDEELLARVKARSSA